MQLFFLDPFWYMMWFLWPYQGDTDGILLYFLQLWYDYIIYFRMLSGYLEILERKAMKLMPSLQVKW